MRFGGLAVLTALVLAVGVLTPATASASEGVSLILQMPGEGPILNSEGKPVMVAGVWHDLVVSLETPVQAGLILEASAVGSQGEGMGNHYLWERDETNDTWSEPLYGFFLESESSSSEGQVVTFRLGVDATALPGRWELAVVKDGTSLGLYEFEVREARIGYGLSSADLSFRAEPFKEAEILSEDSGQYVRIINQGNVPLRLSATFDRLQNRISLVNPTDIAHVSDDIKYFFKLELDPRPPQIINVQGVSRVEAMYLIPSPGSSQIVPAIEGEFGLKVIVGRSGYTVGTVGNVVFQTIDGVRAAFGSLVTWQVYLTGDQEVSLQVDVVGAQLLGVLQGEDLLSLPAVLRPTPNAELPLTIQVRTTVPSVLAEILYTLTVLDTGEVSIYKTTIDVGPRPASPTLQPSLLWFFASLVSASVLAITTYNHWRFINMRSSGVRLSSRRSRTGDAKARNLGERAGTKGREARGKSRGREGKKRSGKGKGDGK